MHDEDGMLWAKSGRLSTSASMAAAPRGIALAQLDLAERLVGYAPQEGLREHAACPRSASDSRESIHAQRLLVDRG